MKENYESMKILLGKIKFDEFKWKLCGDVQVVALLSECNWCTQNTAVCCVSVTVGARKITV
jgi:hypothetical protein